MLPIERTELLRLQVSLCNSSDEEIAGLALNSLQRTDPRAIAAVVDDATTEWLEILIEKLPHPTVLESILHRAELSVDLVRRLAGWVPPELQEVLLLRQEDIRAHPDILDVLESNPYVSPNTLRVILEYREYLVPRRRDIRAPTEEDLEDVTTQVVDDAIAYVAERVPERGEFEDSTGLTDNQIRALPIAVRVKLAFGASKTLRNILLKDPSPHVSVTALNRSAISEREVEQLCRARTTSDDVLGEIARHREWVRKYRIMVALIKNPRTPIAISMQNLPRVSVRDLRVMTRDRNLPDAVRARARQLYQKKVA